MMVRKPKDAAFWKAWRHSVEWCERKTTLPLPQSVSIAKLISQGDRSLPQWVARGARPTSCAAWRIAASHCKKQALLRKKVSCTAKTAIPSIWLPTVKNAERKLLGTVWRLSERHSTQSVSTAPTAESSSPILLSTWRMDYPTVKKTGTSCSPLSACPVGSR